MTNVPTPTFGPRGFIIPQESAILEGVQSDINAAFGGDLNPSLETPQGQLASSMTAIIGNVNDTFQFYTQQFDPAYATGRAQDAIARIYFLERKSSQPTVVQATCTGLAGVTILEGALAIATDGRIYACTQTGVIPSSGSILLEFACREVGPIPCQAGSLNTIYQAIPGWDSINNNADGVLGNDVESRTEFEARRAASVAQNSRGSLPSILGAVLSVPNVIDAFVTENTTAAPLTILGATLAANSVYVAVTGGDPDAVAQAIWSRKAPGCAYNGNTTITVFDNNSGYNPPFPAYQVSFEIPPPLPVLFAVNIANTAQVPANATALIQAALISAFAGGDGGARARIGSKIFASRYYSPVAALGPWAEIVDILIGSNNTPQTTFTASIAGTTMTVTGVTGGVLAVGQTITDGNVITPGTRITAQLTGSPGGTGTYSLTNPQTVGSGVFQGSVADGNSIQVNINQVPTLSANNIVVALV